MYVTTNTGEVDAFDAVTGRRRWSYVPQVDLGATAQAGESQPVNRGVTVAGDRVYTVTFDGRLQALDARTGRRLWTVAVSDPLTGATQNSPPAYWRGRVIVGNAGSDATPVRGAVTAYDARTGRRLWRFYTVPVHAGGGHVWMPPTVDPKTGLVYAGTGNPTPAIATRSGCEDWAAGMVAIDARTGALRWGAHEVCGDRWDYDGGQPPLVFDARVGGRTVRAVGHANKSGTYWIRDAATGRPLAAPRSVRIGAALRPSPSKAGVRVCPGAYGGVSYSPAALDPRARTLFQPVVGLCMRYRRDSVTAGYGHVELGGGEAVPIPGEPATGAIVALNADTGTVRWRRALPAPAVGGALATAGGLVFSGDDDGYLYALDSRSGRTVWRLRVGLPFGSAPLTYRIAGVQYLAVAAGGSNVTSVTRTTPGAKLVVLRLR